MEQRSDFHNGFLQTERRAILHRWVADQVAQDAGANGNSPDSVPLVGYSSEFLDLFLQDAGNGSTLRCREFVRDMVDASVLAGLSPWSLSNFLLSLKNAISSLWTMEAWTRHNDSHGKAPITDMVAVVETTATLDGVLLAGLEMLERRRASDPSMDIDSLEMLEQRRKLAAERKPVEENEDEVVPFLHSMDDVSQLDSVEIAPPPHPPLGGMRGMASALRGFAPPPRTPVEEAPAAPEPDPAALHSQPNLASRMEAWTAARRTAAPVAEPEPSSVRVPRLFDPGDEDFLARISHEFRSPLCSILSVCSMCLSGKESLLTADDGREAFDIIERSARQLLHLTENLMEIQRLDLRKGRTANVSLHEVMEDLASVFGPLARRKGLELRFDVPLQMPEVCTDCESMMAVLRNLLANAINYTSDGHVELWAMIDPDDRSGRSLVLGVSDSGAGIPGDQVSRIFDPFWRGQGPTGDNRGTGLGLAIVREAVTRIGGEIAVQSEPGHGSTFVVAIPQVLVVPAS